MCFFIVCLPSSFILPVKKISGTPLHMHIETLFYNFLFIETDTYNFARAGFYSVYADAEK